MNKLQAKKKIIDYFKNNSIEYRFLCEDDKPMILDSSDTVYMCVCIPDVIGGHIETSIFLSAGYIGISYMNKTKKILQQENIKENLCNNN